MSIATLPGYDGLGEGSVGFSGFSVSVLCHAGVGTSTNPSWQRGSMQLPAYAGFGGFPILARHNSPSAGLILVASASL